MNYTDAQNFWLEIMNLREGDELRLVRAIDPQRDRDKYTSYFGDYGARLSAGAILRFLYCRSYYVVGIDVIKTGRCAVPFYILEKV